MKDDLQLESFTAWMLAAQIGLSAGSPTTLPPSQQVVAVQQQQSADDMMQEALRAGKERMVITDQQGRVLGDVWGTKFQVRATPELYRLMNTPGLNLILYHNHLTNSTYSPADVEEMIECRGLAKSIIVRKNGRSELSNVKSNALSVYNDVQNDLPDRISQDIFKSTFFVMKELQRRGIVSYKEY